MDNKTKQIYERLKDFAFATGDSVAFKNAAEILCKQSNVLKAGNIYHTMAAHGGNNPENVRFTVAKAGDPGIYNEIGIDAHIGEDCVASILVGISASGEIRVLSTTSGDGDGERNVALYPQRDGEDIVDLRFN